MPLQPNLLERTLFYTLNQGPAPLVDLWSAVGFRSVAAAIRLGIIAALAERSQTEADLISALQLDSRGCRILLEGLEQLGYVQVKKERYKLTGMSRKWLTDQAGTNFAPYLTFWDGLLREFWNDLEETLRSGTPSQNLYEWIEDRPQLSQDFQEGMIAIAGFIKSEIAARLKFLAEADVLIDIGGGHAEYSIALCRRYPRLHAQVFDSPQALVAGRKNIARAGLADRIRTRAGNFLSDRLPQAPGDHNRDGYDAALIFNIVHGFSPGDNMDLFRKTHRALKPGGHIVVLEQVDEKTPLPFGNAVVKLLALSYYHTLGGQVYAYGDLVRWLEGAGFSEIQRLDILKVPGTALAVGVKRPAGDAGG